MSSPLATQIRTGACLCKGVTFEAVGPEIEFTICHCKTCQRNTGTAYTANVWFRSKDFKFTAGADLLTQHNDSSSESGRPVTRFFCSKCGSRMLTRSPIIPNIANVPSGVFDGNQEWKPDCEMWLKSKMCFDTEVPGIEKDDRYQDNAGEREFNKLRQKLGEDF